MEKLSVGKYAGLCIVGGEIAYVTCLLYGVTLRGASAELHHAMFELLPGFTWFNISGFFAGLVTIAVWSGIGGVYIAWMHNVSMKKSV